MNNHKILMVFFGMETGGAELQFLELAEYLNNKNHVKLVGLGKRGGLEQQIIDKGIEYEVFDYKSKLGVMVAIINLLLFAANFRPDAIVSTSHIGNLSSFIISKILGIKNLISLQTVSRCMARFKFLDRFVLNRFRCLIAGANDIESYLIRHGISKPTIHVVHNWVDFSTKVSTLSALETRNKFKFGDSFLIGCVARLHNQKGHKNLIASLQYLDFPEFKLILVGDGPEKQNLKEQVANYGFSDAVFFLGEMKDDEYCNLMNSFDLFVLPSLYEGLPRALLDAMYFNKSIVATDVNGNKEAVCHMESGYLVPPEDPTALASGINFLHANPDIAKSLSLNAKAEVEQRFEMIGQLKRLESLLFDLY